MKLPIFIADAFTAKAFRGNPAAVCLLENKLDEDMHQKIAREMNLSETAFIRKLNPSDSFSQSDTLVQDIRYSPDTRKLLVRLSDTYDRSFLENLKVNTQDLLQVENTEKVRGLILTLKGEPGGQTHAFDFYSRYFAPWVGIAEDPVTAFQCSCRGGELEISLRPDGRVDIRGGAAVVVEGTLTA
ncbi:Phenazine biosynthesis-like domain-containing protein [Myotis davidii]|uniref:Phenazine biosynthesis-like domain-containing protein n=1 Tax=Myotis davidii TaxID=225400 RepID=L5M3Q5_MYODS|nr:Phenazine biosynthesis-like domain-containing protein [Myotis davidii]